MSHNDAIPCKVVLIGETGVGKSSILSRYIKNTFDPDSPTTPALDFISKIITIKKTMPSIRFELWDTAGQERYRSLTKVLIKDSAVCLLVYDITKRKSFEELKNYWIYEIREKGPLNLGKI